VRALVIGGTGPTGPYLVNGLLERGYQVSILHRGSHDSDEIPASVERIIGDPHFRETLKEALGARRFDLVIATYGRIRYIAEVIGEHTERLITVGGAPGYRGLLNPDRLFPAGMQTPVPEDAPRVASEEEFRFGYLVRVTEDAVLEGHQRGDFIATHFRYPVVYGPRQITPTIWSIMRRAIDGRGFIVLPEGGLTLITRGYTQNVAHAVLLAVDNADVAGGQIYNCGDVHQLSMAQWVEVVGRTMGAAIEVVSVPDAFAYPARDLMMFRCSAHHQLLDLFKLRSELGYADPVPPVEALERTIGWYQEHPPPDDAAINTDLPAHYRVEDDILTIYKHAVERLGALEKLEKPFHHPYPHPKAPNLAKDHRAR
jgi:nucleoside-diphosphate-sugar epimerase